MLFSWIDWPSREARNSGMKAMMQDERMKTLGMPFDGQRLIFGGWPMVEQVGAKGRFRAMRDRYIIPITTNRDAYIKMALNASRVFKEYGALRVVEAWAMTCPTGRSPTFGARSQRKTARSSSSASSNGPRRRRETRLGPEL